MTPITRQPGRLAVGLVSVAIAAIVFTLFAPASAQYQRPPLQGPAPGRPVESVANRTPPDANAAIRPVQEILDEGIPAIVAEVNGTRVTKDELAQDCLRLHGQAILERLINKYLILNECILVGINVTPQDVEDEIAKTADRFNLPVKEYLDMLKSERGTMLNPT